MVSISQMDIKRADLGLLVSLDALLSERSVTAAARKLGISQPALSTQLARLRDLMGDEILVGNAHGMVPTPRAQAIQAPLRQLLQDMSELILAETGFNPATHIRRFHIAASDMALAAIMPTLLRVIGNSAPNIRLTTAALDHDNMADLAESGRLDMAITNTRRLPESFQVTPLINTDYVVIWRQDHPALGKGLSLDQFCALPQLNVSPIEGSLTAPVDQALQSIGRKRNVTASINSYVLAPALLRGSDLIAVVPKLLPQLDGAGLTVAPLPLKLDTLAVGLGWHPRYRNDRAHRWLRDLIVEAVGKLKS